MRRVLPAFCVLVALLVAAPHLAAQEMSANAKREIEALIAEKRGRTAAQRKLSTSLLYAGRQSRGAAMVAGLGRPLPRVAQRARVDRNGMVVVDIRAAVSADLLRAIRTGGGVVLYQNAKHHVLRARYPLVRLEVLAQRSDVRRIEPRRRALVNVDSANSEGDAAHAADFARATYGISGAGIKIGVISDGIDSLADRQASGDLPGTVTLLPGATDNPGDEGTAMLEIVHDLAPNAQLFFATGVTSPEDMANSISSLRHDYGCQIIVDDVIWFDEGAFQDGVIAQAVNEVHDDGAMYFSSAGNGGNYDAGYSSVWEGDFVDSGADVPALTGLGAVHSFNGTSGPGAATTDQLLFSAWNGASLRWADPLGASSNDYDLYVLDSTMSYVYDLSTDTQDGSQDPFEYVVFGGTGDRLVVVLYSGSSRALRLDAIGAPITLYTPGATVGHNAAEGAITVAAADVATAHGGKFTGGFTNPVEFYSSDGPRRLLYHANGDEWTPGDVTYATGGHDVLKPDITAADCVTVTTPYFTPFCGTSAAAPHAAAIAALLLSLPSAPTRDQVLAAMESTALDTHAPGFDRDSGYGIVMADTLRLLVTSLGGTGSGTVTSAPPGIDCGYACVAFYLQGANVALGAMPDVNSTFASWGGNCSGTDPNVCSVVMTNDRAVTANFACSGSCTATPSPTSTPVPTFTPTPTATPRPLGFQTLPLGASGDPAGSRAALLLGSDGALYGTSDGGGANGLGSVFRVTYTAGSWTKDVIYSFATGVDGANPQGKLFQDTDGALYGTTLSGGSAGAGTVFKLTGANVSWTESVVYDFQGDSDGAFPYSALVKGSDGALYGTTSLGGANSAGTVFRLAFNGSWFETVVHSFGGAGDGSIPHSSLLLATDGALYGTTPIGGATDSGTVYSLSSGGSYSLVYSFAGSSDGDAPQSELIQATNGCLFGTTFAGGTNDQGTLYRLAASGPSWNHSVVRNFSSPEMSGPHTAVLQASDGNLYGTSSAGGPVHTIDYPRGIGAASQILFGNPWPESVLHNFTGGKDGADPSTLIVGQDGALYGTTALGGPNGGGVVFRIGNGLPTPTPTFRPTPTSATSTPTSPTSTPTAPTSTPTSPTSTPTSPTSTPTSPTPTPLPGAADFFTLPPCRIADTRNAAGPFGAPALFGATDRTFSLAGVCGIPIEALAVSVNITITQPTTVGDLRLFPAGQTAPLASVINFGAGQTRANNAIVALNSSAQMAVRNDQGAGATVQFIMDVNGYFGPGSN